MIRPNPFNALALFTAPTAAGWLPMRALDPARTWIVPLDRIVVRVGLRWHIDGGPGVTLEGHPIHTEIQPPWETEAFPLARTYRFAMVGRDVRIVEDLRHP